MHSNMKKFILLACLFSWGLLSCNKDEDEKNYCSKVAKPINRFGHAGQYTYTCGHCGNNVSEPAKKNVPNLQLLVQISMKVQQIK